MAITEEAQIELENASCCHTCKVEFQEKPTKVRDHYHRTGKYRGCAHDKWTMIYLSRRVLFVILFNFKLINTLFPQFSIIKACNNKYNTGIVKYSTQQIIILKCTSFQDCNWYCSKNKTHKEVKLISTYECSQKNISES